MKSGLKTVDECKNAQEIVQNMAIYESYFFNMSKEEKEMIFEEYFSDSDYTALEEALPKFIARDVQKIKDDQLSAQEIDDFLFFFGEDLSDDEYYLCKGLYEMKLAGIPCKDCVSPVASEIDKNEETDESQF